MVFIIVALSIVPGLIAGTIDTLKSSRSGGGSYIQSRSANGVMRQYLVMIGDFQSAKRVADMLSGFFNKVGCRLFSPLSLLWNLSQQLF